MHFGEIVSDRNLVEGMNYLLWILTGNVNGIVTGIVKFQIIGENLVSKLEKFSI